MEIPLQAVLAELQAIVAQQATDLAVARAQLRVLQSGNGELHSQQDVHQDADTAQEP